MYAPTWHCSARVPLARLSDGVSHQHCQVPVRSFLIQEFMPIALHALKLAGVVGGDIGHDSKLPKDQVPAATACPSHTN
jgi:hypothetical protein